MHTIFGGEERKTADDEDHKSLAGCVLRRVVLTISRTKINLNLFQKVIFYLVVHKHFSDGVCNV